MTKAGDSIDWQTLMAFGLGTLRLAPAHFWSMTPVELMAALEGAGILSTAGRRPTRSTLMALMTQFPDQTETVHADR